MACAVAVFAVLFAPIPASAAFTFEQFSLGIVNQDGSPATQAGSHPFALTNSFAVATKTDPRYGLVPDEMLKDLELKLPVGLVGAPGAVPRCSGADFKDIDSSTKLPACSDDTAVGVVSLKLALQLGQAPSFISAPVYNVEPPPGVAGQFGFSAYGVPVPILFTLADEPPYAVSVSLSKISQLIPVFSSELTIWGNPADPAHDPLRGACVDTSPSSVPGFHGTGGDCRADLSGAPLLTLPRDCTKPLVAGYAVDTWSAPDVLASGAVLAEPAQMTGCGKLGFAPSLSIQPTNGAVQSPTGLEVSLSAENEGLTSAAGISRADLDRAVLSLPGGLVLNPSAAAGLQACTPAQLQRERLVADRAGCPEASKIGTAEVQTPLLDGSADGSLFVAQPVEGSLFSLYAVVRNAPLGILIKEQVALDAHPSSGRLTVTAANLPALPLSRLRLRFREGERGVLTTPPSCGQYMIAAKLFSTAAPEDGWPTTSQFSIGHGLGHGPCPLGDDARPFAPTLTAGTLAATAGADSPLVLKIQRQDGSKPLRSIRVHLPAGLSGSLVGLRSCSDLSLVIAASRSALEEASAPSCPAASELGQLTVGVGAGAIPLYLGGHAYLAGPYEGAPISIALVVPALAGPFDLGTEVIRIALRVDPRTAEIDGASDPIPTILAGVPLNVRSVALDFDRPRVIRNPTGCGKAEIAATAEAVGGQRTSLAEPFQVGACASLRFEPQLSIRMQGSPRRGMSPQLRATLRSARGKEANVRRLAVSLPPTELLASRHIRGICSRQEFATRSCPQNSIYGRARVWSPLLDEPLAGPVYLRAGSHRLPDLAIPLDGRFRIELTAGMSAKRGRLRIAFPQLPDIPVRKFMLAMRGGRGGLFVNSGGLCGDVLRARVSATGHNGMLHGARPIAHVSCDKNSAQ